MELKNTQSIVKSIGAKPIDSTGCFSIYEAMETFETWVIRYQRDIGSLGWISLDYPDSLTFIATRPSRFKHEEHVSFFFSRPSKRSIVLPSPLNHPTISLSTSSLSISLFFHFFFFFFLHIVFDFIQDQRIVSWKLLHGGGNPWGWIFRLAHCLLDSLDRRRSKKHFEECPQASLVKISTFVKILLANSFPFLG